MEQFFAREFQKEHNKYSLFDIEKAFYTWVVGMRRKYLLGESRTQASAATSISVADLKKKEDAEKASRQFREAVRRIHVLYSALANSSQQYHRRLGAAQSIPNDADPERMLEQLVIKLDLDGESDNEEVVDSRNVKVRHPRRPMFRSTAARPHLNTLDYIASGLKNVASDRRGNHPLPRMPPLPGEARIKQDARPVGGLWRNLYDPDWLQTQTADYIKYTLRPLDEDFPTTFPARLTE